MSLSLLHSCFLNTIPVLFGLFTLASCIAAPRTEFVRADGTVGYAISCQTMNECATEARELCPHGHDVVPAASGTDDTTARGGLGGTPEVRLLIACKPPSPSR